MGCTNPKQVSQTDLPPPNSGKGGRDSSSGAGEGGEGGRNNENIPKLLLLGAGGSGKSTIFKQLKSLYGEGLTQTEREKYKWTIHNNIITSIKMLCVQSEIYGAIDPANTEARDTILTCRDEAPITPQLGGYINALWKDPGIRATYEMRAKFQLPTDSIHYFFNKIDEVSRPEYLPSAEDVVRCRIHSTGVQDAVLSIDDCKTRIVDVGGQRCERRKWQNCFQNVTAVLFVAAMSEYNQSLYEEEDVNRLTETLTVFENIVNSSFFHKTPVILLLNKRDLLEEKCSKDSIANYFPEYNGDDTYQSALDWMASIFESRNEQERSLVIHFMSATDSQDVREAFEGKIKAIVLEANAPNLQ